VRGFWCASYLSRGYPLHAEIPDALLRHAPRLRIHAPELSDPQARTLAQAGAVVEREPVATAQALASSSLVIHLGGIGLAAEALMAGIPQLILSMQIEQWLTGQGFATRRTRMPRCRLRSRCKNRSANRRHA